MDCEIRLATNSANAEVSMSSNTNPTSPGLSPLESKPCCHQATVNVSEGSSSLGAGRNQGIKAWGNRQKSQQQVVNCPVDREGLTHCKVKYHIVDTIYEPIAIYT